MLVAPVPSDDWYPLSQFTEFKPMKYGLLAAVLSEFVMVGPVPVQYGLIPSCNGEKQKRIMRDN